MTVRTRTDRNFRRARVKPGRRRRFRAAVSWKAVWRVICVLLLVFGTYQSVTLAFTAPLLRVERITVQGNVRLSNGQILALVHDLRGTNIFRADLGEFKRRLGESPWVEEVALRRVLPSTVEIFLSERYPVGLCRIGDELFLVDGAGNILDRFGPQYAEFDLPIIDGLFVAAGGADATIDPRRADLAARVISSLGRTEEMAPRVSQVDVTNLHDAVVLLDSDPALLHLGTERFLERVQAYLDLSGTLRERVGEIDYVDLRFDRRVYVRPAPSSGRGTRRPAPRPQVARQF